MPRKRGNHGDLPLEANINVTSLVDVAFTLLVIFIITAPILQGGVEVSVPRADVQPLTAQDEPFFVSVTAEGRIYVEEDEWTLDQFREGIPGVLAAGGIERVYLRGDSAAMYGPMLQVFTIIANTGVKPALVAEPWKGN